MQSSLGIHDTRRSNAINLLTMRAICTYKRTMLGTKTPTKPHQQGPHCPHTGFLSANTPIETILTTSSPSPSTRPLTHNKAKAAPPAATNAPATFTPFVGAGPLRSLLRILFSAWPTLEKYAWALVGMAENQDGTAVAVRAVWRYASGLLAISDWTSEGTAEAKAAAAAV